MRLRYIGRRVLLLVPSLLAVYTITFLLMHATPGGPWDTGGGQPLPVHVIERLNEVYGLSDPMWQQYLNFLKGIVTEGSLGVSFARGGQGVTDIIARTLPVSVQLGLVAMVLAVVGGITLGTISALYRNTVTDYMASFFSIVGISTPSYVSASLLVLILAVTFGLVPTGGWEGILSVNIIIPSVALALHPMALLARYTRSSMLEVWGTDYVRVARSKGLRERWILLRHALPNALIPVATVAGIAFAEVVTGSFFVETITGQPGIGRHFVNSIFSRDYPVILGTTLVYATIVMVMNLVVDILYTFLDPRVTYD